jgi:DNA-binding response OmpR family regulator
VVDDDPFVLKFVQANLEVRDFQVLVATEMEEAIRIAEKEKPDMRTLPGSRCPVCDDAKVATTRRTKGRMNSEASFWSGRRDSNSRLFAWEANILPLNYSRRFLVL